MTTNIVTKLGVHHKKLLLTSTLFVVLLVLTSITTYTLTVKNDDVKRGVGGGVFGDGSVFVEGVVCVGSEVELEAAINNMPLDMSVVIALNNNITLTKPLTILANKNVTLTSNKEIEFYKLGGIRGESTIIVESLGVLQLDGIIVTHNSLSYGLYQSGSFGVFVNSGGELVLFDGEISGNQHSGVFNNGTFSMFGGKIIDNISGSERNAGGLCGCGVYNLGVFGMSGGEISNNVGDTGGGVCNVGGVFEMSGGLIFNNRAEGYGVSGTKRGGWGGGVFNFGVFRWSGGVIFGNRATGDGGNVYNVGGGVAYYFGVRDFIWVGVIFVMVCVVVGVMVVCFKRRQKHLISKRL